MKSKLELIKDFCKAGVYVSINAHRDSYVTAEAWLKDATTAGEIDWSGALRPIYDKCAELNTLIEISAYPTTPIGSYCVIHYDLELALDEMVKILGIEVPVCRHEFGASSSEDGDPYLIKGGDTYREDAEIEWFSYCPACGASLEDHPNAPVLEKDEE